MEDILLFIPILTFGGGVGWGGGNKIYTVSHFFPTQYFVFKSILFCPC